MAEAKQLAKPQLRNLLFSNVKFHLFAMLGVVTATTLLFKIFVADARKKKYEEFYKTYDPEASLKRMCESGYMNSCGTPKQ